MKKCISMLCLALLLLSIPAPALAWIIDESDWAVNTFAPDPSCVQYRTTAVITVQKAVQNLTKSEIGPEGFHFVLESLDTGWTVMEESGENGLAVFHLDFTDADSGKTFRYRLFEKDDDRKGVIYSDQVYDVQVRVHGRGENLAASVRLNGVDTAVAPFRNYYKPAKPKPPRTGDTAMPVLYAAMMLTGGLGALLLRRRMK